MQLCGKCSKHICSTFYIKNFIPSLILAFLPILLLSYFPHSFPHLNFMLSSSNITSTYFVMRTLESISPLVPASKISRVISRCSSNKLKFPYIWSQSLTGTHGHRVTGVTCLLSVKLPKSVPLFSPWTNNITQMCPDSWILQGQLRNSCHDVLSLY